jgi:chloride channel 3/4/5
MPQDEEANEQTRLLDPRVAQLTGRKPSRYNDQSLSPQDASSILSSHVSKEEQELAGTAVGERLPYNDYTTIDWLHDLVRSCA